MGMYTYLYDNPMEDSEIPPDLLELLNDVRRMTGKKWRIVPCRYLQDRLFRKPIMVLAGWELCCHTASIEYHVINFYGDYIRAIVPLSEIAAYLFGIVTGYNYNNADSAQEGGAR